MDFLWLAIREARRNSTRTLVAVLAVALATASPILAQVIPDGYPKGVASVERAFAGGDVLVWSAPAPVDARSRSQLLWLPWDGRDWQSHALYFLPEIERKGYLAESPGFTWRPISTEAVRASLDGVAGVTEILPYLAMPCVVETRHGSFDVILRGRGPEPASEFAFHRFVKEGRALTSTDAGRDHAVVPLRGRAWEKRDIDFEIPFTLVVPRLAAGRGGGGDGGTRTPGVSWDEPLRVSVLPVGGYEVQTGEEHVPRHGSAEIETPTIVPLYWDRPEVVVTTETFLRFASLALGGPLDEDSFPVYQVSLKVGRMSDLKAGVAVIRKTLGPGFAVYSVPELLGTRGSGASALLMTGDLWPVFVTLVFVLSGVVVAGSVYILLAQQRRKIGLMRVIGAKRRDIVLYTLGVTLYVTLIGLAAGFVTGKVLSLSVVFFSDLDFGEWLGRSARELGVALGLSLSVTLALGAAVGVWASGIPSAEVLRRE